MDQKGLARMVIAHLEIRPSGIRPSVSKPLQRPSFSKMSLPSNRSSPSTASPNAKRGYSRPECQPDGSYKVSSGEPHFHARLAPEPPIFHFAVAHSYQNVGWMPPPPPGPRPKSDRPPRLHVTLLQTKISSFTDFPCRRLQCRGCPISVAGKWPHLHRPFHHLTSIQDSGERYEIKTSSVLRYV